MEKCIAVVGVGNILMADEGVGVKVLQELKRRDLEKEIDLVDAGTGFFTIVSDLSSYDKVVIIDAVRGGKAPGTIYRFELSDIAMRGIGDDDGFLSVHDIGVPQALRMHSLVGSLPDEIVLYGVEPLSIKLSLEVTPRLKPVVGRLADLVVEEIKQDKQSRRKGNGCQCSKT
jgi:hydrogenase maturation protease